METLHTGQPVSPAISSKTPELPFTGIPLSLSEEQRHLLPIAAIWSLVLKEEDTPEHRRAFDHWLMQSADHVQAFLLVDASLEVARDYLAQDKSSPAPAKCIENEAALQTPPAPSDADTNLDVSDPPASGHRRDRLKSFAGISTLAACILIVWFAAPRHAPLMNPNTTPRPAPSLTGSSKIIDSFGIYQLSETSWMRLTAHSRVKVTDVAEQRGDEVSLLEGVAYFSGQHEPERPLRIRSGQTVIDVTGTSLEVSNTDGTTSVFVFEGEVQLSRCLPSAHTRVENAPISSERVSLTKNQSVSLASNECTGYVEVRPINDDDSPQSGADGDKWLVFNGTPVVTAAEMFNRANTRCLIIVDNSVAQIKIGGSFRATDLDGFLHGLDFLGVTAIRQDDPAGTTVIHLVQKR